MTARATPSESFVKLYRELVSSDAWRSLSINGRRLIDFLMIEHMSKGGKKNGHLHAPRAQLRAFGIAHRHISAAIDEVDARGMVDVRRGVGRMPSVYALTWLPVGKDSPSHRWRAFRDPALMPMETVANTRALKPSPEKEVPKGTYKGFRRGPTKPVAVSEGDLQTPISRVSEGDQPSRKESIHGGRDILYLSARGLAA